jgi:hypothetical protein
MMESFASVISYILSGLKIYLAERHTPSKSKRPIGGTVAEPL